MKTLAIALCVSASAAAFSARSSFAPRPNSAAVSQAMTASTSGAGMTMYDSSRDPPSSPELNAWSVLASTERWISATLAEQKNGASNNMNPYTRKEVVYDCESFSDSPMIVASLFRRLKEARKSGETHGRQQMKIMEELKEAFEPKTFRQTHVIVVPGNKVLRDNFIVFDSLVQAVNDARRQARDLVLTPNNRDMDNEWSVAVNCAHLHPQFGQLTRLQELEQMRNAPEEVDVNYQEYQEKKMQARRSPYPSFVIEVRATPPPDFGDSPPLPYFTQLKEEATTEEGGISSSDIAALEALFSKSAHFHDNDKKQQEEIFYDSLAQNLKELSIVTPLQTAQEWMIKNDADAINAATQVAFTESATEHVDAAYEFLFTNIAMIRENPARQYLVMPNFLSSSATSLEKFCQPAEKIIDILPELKNKVALEIFHPEHIQPSKRSPMPIIVLEWKE